MNKTDIYTVLLSAPKSCQFGNVHGFSYRISNENGVVKICEISGPVRITLWEEDGPELADLTEEQVKERIEEVLSA